MRKFIMTCLLAAALAAGASQAQAGDTNMVTLKTNMGDIVLELDAEKAPNTTKNFLDYVKEGFFDGTIFHRVIPGFMIQGGCPDGTGMGGPGYCIKGEFTQNLFQNNLKHDRGVLSMARTMRPNSAGSQFFIMHDDAPHLDGGYAAFGRVISGIEAVDTIAECKTNIYNDKPVKKQVMKKVTVETFGVEYPEPEKY